MPTARTSTVQLRDDDAKNVANVPGCDKETALLSRDAQRNFLSKYVPDFFDAALGNTTSPEQIDLDARAPTPPRIHGVPVLVALSTPWSQRAIVTQPISKDALNNNGFGGFSVTEGAARVEMCEQRTVCGRWSVVPANPAMARFSWTSPLGAAWEMPLGDPPADLSSFATLSLRMATDPSDALNAHRKPQALRIALVDATGKRAEVILSSKNTVALAYPAGEPDAKTFRWLGHAPLTSVRLLLSQFGGIDLSRVAALRIEPAGDLSGSLFLADIEFIRPQAGPAAQ